jgi:hypothetical protein
MVASPHETGWTKNASAEQAPYRGEFFNELLPERDPIFRHLGATAVASAMSASAVTTAPPSLDDLPSFEAYIAAKYPDLPPGAAAELVRRFHQLVEEHGGAERPQPEREQRRQQ